MGLLKNLLGGWLLLGMALVTFKRSIHNILKNYFFLFHIASFEEFNILEKDIHSSQKKKKIKNPTCRP